MNYIVIYVNDKLPADAILRVIEQFDPQEPYDLIQDDRCPPNMVYMRDRRSWFFPDPPVP